LSFFHICLSSIVKNKIQDGRVLCLVIYTSTSRDSLGIPWVSYSIGRATIFMHGIYPALFFGGPGRNHDIKVEIRLGPKTNT
jgi:hypothetical protein